MLLIMMSSFRFTLIRIRNSYFASGTGAAGIAGAFLWWEVRGLGVRMGVGVSSVRLLFSSSSTSSCSDAPTHTFLFQLMPSIIPLTYHFLLPSPSSFRASHNTNTPSAYVPLATAEDDAEGVREAELDDLNTGEFRPQGVEEEQELMIDDSNGKIASASKKVSVTLSANDKWRLVKPLLGRYMLPLCAFLNFLPPTPLRSARLTKA
jgi:battenin